MHCVIIGGAAGVMGKGIYQGSSGVGCLRSVVAILGSVMGVFGIMDNLVVVLGACLETTHCGSQRGSVVVIEFLQFLRHDRCAAGGRVTSRR